MELHQITEVASLIGAAVLIHYVLHKLWPS